MLYRKSYEEKETASEKFMKAVLTYVYFPFDHKKIRDELASHIDDLTEELMKEGLSEEAAVSAAVQRMGDAKRIGKELNKVHNPVLGWIYVYSSLSLIVTAIFAFLLLIVPLTSPLTARRPIDEISQKDILYHVYVDQSCRIDNMILSITDIIYDTDHSLHILYKTYSASIFIDSWNFPYIGTITDENQNEYYSNEMSINTIFVEYHDRIIQNFPEDSSFVTISYDRYNRNYEFHIDLLTDQSQISAENIQNYTGTNYRNEYSYE